MTENEAIALLVDSYIVDFAGNTDKNRMDCEKFIVSALKELQEYRKLGTVEEVGEAVEKTKPKKIIKRSFVIPYEGMDACPVCKEPLGRITNYCRNCGQRLESEE